MHSRLYTFLIRLVPICAFFAPLLIKKSPEYPNVGFVFVYLKSLNIILKLSKFQRKIPETGWTDDMIEQVVRQLADLDSNNSLKTCGVGEREGRIACSKKSLLYQ